MRVALVDASRTVLKCVARLLEARHHEVHCFSDGREALAFLNADQGVEALITSTEPQSISGVELCWETRLIANARRPIYVLMMSSTTDWRNVIEALDSGADDFLGKPPVAEELYARLRAAERVNSMQRELITLATTDALTGVLNRRAFFERAHDICALARSGVGVTAIMMDIDHFKQINDDFGHDAGDTVLRIVARTAAAKAEVVGRLGGEEFALLLDHRTLAEAVSAAETLRGALATLEFMHATGPFHITCSMGVSEWRPGDSIDRLLKRADMVLYDAKTSGRNRVVAARADMADAAVAPSPRLREHAR